MQTIDLCFKLKEDFQKGMKERKIMLKGIFIMSDELIDLDYPPYLRDEMKKEIQLLEPVLTPDNYTEHWDVIHEADVIFSGMGSVEMDKAFLDRAPNLKAVFYAASSVKYMFTDDEVWKRDIIVSTARTVNAIPVAQFSMAQILLSLKNSWYLARKVRDEETFTHGNDYPIPGMYDTNVGIISLSAIGVQVVHYLKEHGLNILVYDPYVNETEAQALGVQLKSLEELFKESDVVSLHAPLLPETVDLVTGKHIRSMKKYATFINTARGEIVKEDEMIEVLQERTDLTALLDVTSPEPPHPGSPLYSLENVMLTPHISGSTGKERQRQGEEMFKEFKRYVNNESLKHQISRKQFDQLG